MAIEGKPCLAYAVRHVALSALLPSVRLLLGELCTYPCAAGGVRGEAVWGYAAYIVHDLCAHARGGTAALHSGALCAHFLEPALSLIGQAGRYSEGPVVSVIKLRLWAAGHAMTHPDRVLSGSWGAGKARGDPSRLIV